MKTKQIKHLISLVLIGLLFLSTSLVLAEESQDHISYQTHVQNEGWQGWKTDGNMSGTEGKAYRLEGIKIKTLDHPNLGIMYQTHVQNIGWQGWKTDGNMSGTEGKSYRLEGVKIKLTGADSKDYDVYYQVHAENFGWLGWAKNGEESGTEGYGYRLEGIKILILPKEEAPAELNNTNKLAFYKAEPKIEKQIGSGDLGAVDATVTDDVEDYGTGISN